MSNSFPDFEFYVMLSSLVVFLCDPMTEAGKNTRLARPASVYRIFQARILDWVTISLLPGIFLKPRSNTHLLYETALAGLFFTTETT